MNPQTKAAYDAWQGAEAFWRQAENQRVLDLPFCAAGVFFDTCKTDAAAAAQHRAIADALKAQYEEAAAKDSSMRTSVATLAILLAPLWGAVLYTRLRGHR